MPHLNSTPPHHVCSMTARPMCAPGEFQEPRTCLLQWRCLTSFATSNSKNDKNKAQPTVIAKTLSARRIINIVLFLSVGVSVVAQEKPSILTKQCDPSAHYRQDVCGRHATHCAGKVELRHALEGLKLRPLMSVSRLFPLEEGMIDPDDPGVVAVLLEVSLTSMAKTIAFEFGFVTS